MNYELDMTQALLDAGFPLKHMPVLPPPDRYYNLVSKETGETVHVVPPTLSELIRACGEDFWEVGRRPTGELDPLHPLKWTAHGFRRKNTRLIITEAKTPEEAVAGLWLQINRSAQNV